MGGMHHNRPYMWNRPYRGRGCCGCLFPVIGMAALLVGMFAILF